MILETARLLLRRPQADDARRIFERYANDRRVTRYLGWPTHHSLADTEGFLNFCDTEWQRWPVGPFLIESRANGVLLGSTGLAFESSTSASTGYVLAHDAWGHGYATEALIAMRDLAARLHVTRLYALCHPEHRASSRVLEKAGFALEGILLAHTQFPNLTGAVKSDVQCYVTRPIC